MKRPAQLAIFVLAVTVFTSAMAFAQAPTPQNLPLQPGDRIAIKIWADSTLADSLTVADNGSVMLPRLGAISIANLPAPAVGDSVRAAYATLLNPVSVQVLPLRRVSIAGEVHNPGVFYLETRTTVRDAIAHAGGIGDLGREDPIILIRDGAQVQLDHWRIRSDSTAVIHSGDVIIVQRESWAKRNIFSIISGVGIVASLMITIFR